MRWRMVCLLSQVVCCGESMMPAIQRPCNRSISSASAYPVGSGMPAGEAPASSSARIDSGERRTVQ